MASSGVTRGREGERRREGERGHSIAAFRKKGGAIDHDLEYFFFSDVPGRWDDRSTAHPIAGFDHERCQNERLATAVRVTATKGDRRSLRGQRLRLGKNLAAGTSSLCTPPPPRAVRMRSARRCRCRRARRTCSAASRAHGTLPYFGEGQGATNHTQWLEGGGPPQAYTRRPEPKPTPHRYCC